MLGIELDQRGASLNITSLKKLLSFVQSSCHVCNNSFTPFDAKLVNEMLLRFKNISTKFPCKFFFFKTPFLLKLATHVFYILDYIYIHT